MGKDKKEKSPWVKVKKRLRNLTWIGERISLNWMKVYSFRPSSRLSLLRLQDASVFVLALVFQAFQSVDTS